MLMTSCFVCATLNLGRKKSTGTEPEMGRGNDYITCMCMYSSTCFSIFHYHVLSRPYISSNLQRQIDPIPCR